jgi:pimeloyl-ACP methyl ester carboxylesterase
MLIGNFFIAYENNRLHYAKSGSGASPLLLFHGFGQSSIVFDAWVPMLEKTYTLYAFDLFFHGKSEWESKRCVEKGDWKNLIELFLKKENIIQFAVAGFSLGGKFAMVTVESFPERVTKLFLLAPDGIKTSAWYSLATYPIATRSIFKSMIKKPERFFSLVKIARKFGWIDKGIVRFVENQMNTEAKRKQVYLSWVFFRHIKINLNNLAELLNENSIAVIMLVGKYDKVILAENMNNLLDKIQHKKLFLLDAGHNDLILQGASKLI